jgi:hypothetical protein
MADDMTETRRSTARCAWGAALKINRLSSRSALSHEPDRGDIILADLARHPLFIVVVVTPRPSLRRYADADGRRVMNALPASFLMAN